jgi:uncharacterized protein (TIGR03067 family)
MTEWLWGRSKREDRPRLIVKGNTFTLVGTGPSGRGRESYRIALNAGARPRAIDLKWGPLTYPGVYALRGGVLQIAAVTELRVPRPRSVSSPGKLYQRWTFRRAK